MLLCSQAQRKNSPDQLKAREEVNPGTKNRWKVMRAQRNRFTRNINEIKAMGCQNSKETVVEEKEKKLWNSKK